MTDPDPTGSANAPAEPQEQAARKRPWTAPVLIVAGIVVVAASVAAIVSNGSSPDSEGHATPAAEASPGAPSASPASPRPTASTDSPDDSSAAPAPSPDAPAAPVPTIVSFTVSPDSVDCDGDRRATVSLTAQWEALDADRAWIGVATNDAEANPVAEVAPGGGSSSALSYSCTDEEQAYTLTVRGPGGQQSETVFVVATNN